MLKKILPLMLVLVMVMGIFSGCGGTKYTEEQSKAIEYIESIFSGSEDYMVKDIKIDIDTAYQEGKYQPSKYLPVNIKDMLKEEGYSDETIDFAIKNCNVDWVNVATIYVEECADWSLNDEDTFYGGISEKQMRKDMGYIEFTEEQIESALKKANIDWNEQALGSAERFLFYWKDGAEDEASKKAFESEDHYGSLMQVLCETIGYTEDQADKAAKEAINNL